MDTKKLNKLSIKDFIKDNSTAGSRLQSLRLPRDLSLGGTKLPKKLYTPNLNVVRNKDKGKEILRRTDRNMVERKDKLQDKQKQRFVQSTGVFSEGVGEAVRSTEKRVYFKTEKGHLKDYERPPTVKKDCWAVIDQKSENNVFEDIIKHEFDSDSDEKEEKLPFVPVNWCTTDLQEVPMKDKIKVEPKSEVSELETSYNILPREYADIQQNTNSDTTLALWQLPDSFAFKNIVDNLKSKNCVDCKLTDLPEGKIGKICIRKSGKINVHIGGLKYELESSEFESFTEELVALDVKSPQESTATVLGEIKSRFQLNPDWTSLLC
ncbi:hypothetical protein NQ314_010422 [Rhamnusium bicolor]|uniref:DNA-directed RNA polymerase III subunit RPC4 n=1 Tax=Rhamnusium bicolor TaxID=1586634 RepID=A0AAV8XS35_9CUCU|nr:hypothetical protein NQ314_010422 [Rhamnusium bicolor]